MMLFGCGGEGPTAPPAARFSPDGGTDVQTGRILGSVSSDDDDGAPDTSDDDDEVDEDFFVGRWRQVVGSCEYNYRFTDSHDFDLTSTNGESIDGSYELEQSDIRSGRWILTLDIDADNGGQDCEGQMINEVGVSYFVVLDPVTDDRIDVYRSESSASSEFRWNRLR